VTEWLCYTDGSAKTGEDAPGGWGYVVRPPRGEMRESFGSALGTLAKVMEYRAVAEALQVLPDGARAVIFSDNQSLVENLSKRLSSWAEHDFRTVDGAIAGDVRRIHDAIEARSLTIRWQWVRGHQGNAGNMRADALAAQGRREAGRSRM
jgi:ribonuclease HI